MCDFSRTLLFPVDEKCDMGLNAYQAKVSADPNYYFFDFFKFNNRLLTYLDKIKADFALYVFTTGRIQETPEIKEKLDLIFKKIYTPALIGFEKTNIKAYAFIARDLTLKPEEILLIDDNEANLAAADFAGLISLQFKEGESFYQQFNKLLIRS